MTNHAPLTATTTQVAMCSVAVLELGGIPPVTATEMAGRGIPSTSTTDATHIVQLAQDQAPPIAAHATLVTIEEIRSRPRPASRQETVQPVSIML